MSPPVLIGFAGVLVAAVVTGMLAGRCVRQPRIGFIVWTAAILGLTIALAAQSMGFARGFSPVTFRAVQLFALLLAPLWLAWGLVELVVANEAVRFAMRLLTSALTVVASVILATDPLTAQPFSKSWPLTGLHFQPISHYALDAVQAVAVVAVVGSAAMVAARARSDPRSRSTIAAVVAVGLAVFMTAGLRFSLPARAAYPLLSMLAAALVWFGASRVGELPRQAAERDGRRDVMRDGRSPDRSGNRPDDDRWPDDAYRPVEDYAPDGQYATYGQRGSQRGAPPGPGRSRETGDVPGAGPAARSANGRDQGRRVNSGPQPPMPERQDRHRGSRLGDPSADDRLPGTQAVHPLGGQGGHGIHGGQGVEAALAEAEFGPQVNAGESPATTRARPYGRIVIFTLLDDRVADFDRLAEQAAEEVRTDEPDTLVYVIHLVPNAPLQRIFYEIYRDRAAFDSHESQPYMQRFVAERRSCVLATNVIELRLKYAKVAPLPSPQASAPARPAAPPPATRTQLPPGPPQRLQPLPPGHLGAAAARGVQGAPGPQGTSGPQGTQRLQPLPPARPPRPDQPRPDQPRPDQPRPDQRWPDQRQVPSAGRRYGG
jgi:quinol monooxygenase YgiN